jgi:NOL1/NOP2/fmu family ribosome biogenesis protein
MESQSTQKQAWGYRFYPDKVKGEGLFAACLQKKESSGDVPPVKDKEHQKANFKEIDQIKPYINNAADFFFFKVNDDWLAINRHHKESLAILQRYLYIKKSGIRIGKLMGKDLIPDHELALSLIVKKDQFLQTELNKDQAIQYLRRENITDLEVTDKGWSLMDFEGHALGWAKLLPNRINNYYPKEIRILSRAES